MQSINKTFIILVNYNSWKDTIICLEDLKQKDWRNFEVVLVDNFSTDNSVESIENYISGHDLSLVKEKFPNWQRSTYNNQNLPIHFLKSDFNKGFASGNNIGIEFALSKYNKPFYIWMLNNDTVVKHNSLPKLISFFESNNYGLIGSKILDFDPPHEIQSLYGSFCEFSGRVRVVNTVNSKVRMSYPIGASMFTSSVVVEKVGMLNEDYFLYFEEIDYATRVVKNNYKIGICLASIVYHKQGSSTKAFEKEKLRNLTMESYKYKGLIKFYKNYYKKYLLIAYLNLAAKGIKLLIKGEFKNARLVFLTLFTN